MDFDRDKFKRLVHYVCHRCEDPRRLGSIKLNKILWFADMLTFERTGQTLTGEQYVKRQFGPAPRHIVPVIQELEEAGTLSVRRPEMQYEPVLYFATERPDLRGFSADDISLVDGVMREICENHTAMSISQLTHDAIYDLAEMGEEIPCEAFLASRLGEIDEQDVRWARQAVANAAR